MRPLAYLINLIPVITTFLWFLNLPVLSPPLYTLTGIVSWWSFTVSGCVACADPEKGSGIKQVYGLLKSMLIRFNSQFTIQSSPNPAPYIVQSQWKVWVCPSNHNTHMKNNSSRISKTSRFDSAIYCSHFE